MILGPRMETSFSNEFKKRFLFEFTKEMILHSEKRDIIKLENVIYSKEKKIAENKENVYPVLDISARNELIAEEKITEITAKKPEVLQNKEAIQKISIVPLKPFIHHFEEPKKEIAETSQEKPAPQQQAPAPIPKKPMGRLYIPETRMPPSLEYLKPSFVENKTTTDWEKLNPLIKDRAVRTIEVNPDEKIRVSGSMGERTTNIILNTEEINEIINKFAYVSRIPVSEGVYKVVVENLIFFAVISGVVGSRFVIQKIIPVQNVYPNYDQY
jgi:hypothetical protein